MPRRIEAVPRPRVAAIYRRVSSLKQSTEDKSSLDTQLAEARKWCAERGWDTAEPVVFTDVGSGEDLWQRGQLMAMRDDAEHGRVGLVLAHAVDPLPRDPTGAHTGVIPSRLPPAGH